MTFNLLILARKNKLLLTSANLILGTLLAAGFGFLFWVIIARKYDPYQVGIATTLITMSSLVSLLGLAGFDTVFIRFLGKSKNRNAQINSGMLTAGLLTAAVSGLFCAVIPVISMRLKIIDTNPLYILTFTIVSVLTTWNTLTNSVLIAYNKSSYVLAINIAFSVLRLILPFTIVSHNAIHIFVFVGISQAFNVLLSIYLLIRYCDYTPSFRIDKTILLLNLRYSMGVYCSNILNLLPDSALPIIVINRLGAINAAYFYIAFTISNLLYTIAFSIAQATLAHAAQSHDQMFVHIRNALKLMSLMMIPGIIAVVIICPYVLGIFGHNYRSGSTGILRIMSISGLGVMLYAILGTAFKLQSNLKAVITTTGTNALIIIILSLLLLRPLGLNGIGWAWFIGSFASVAVGGLFLYSAQLKNRLKKFGFSKL